MKIWNCWGNFEQKKYGFLSKRWARCCTPNPKLLSNDFWTFKCLDKTRNCEFTWLINQTWKLGILLSSVEPLRMIRGTKSYGKIIIYWTKIILKKGCGFFFDDSRTQFGRQSIQNRLIFMCCINDYWNDKFKPLTND